MSIRIIQGDVRDELPKLLADSFDCIVTSPPYFGLRDYGTAMWEGGDPACDHKNHINRNDLGRNREASGGTFHASSVPHDSQPQFKYECGKCGARRIDAQIGLEPTLDAYLETIVGVCRELRRVLKPSGVFFLNIGDSYANAGGLSQAHRDGCGGIGLKGTRGKQPYSVAASYDRVSSLGGAIKPKDLCLVPHRLGIALQNDGWWVRSDIIWHKKNPMPESCTDRPTSAHETVWMLTKSARYFWDAEAVKEEATFSRPNNMEKASPKTLAMQDNGTHGKGGNLGGTNLNYDSRNIRNVWTIPSHPFPGAHFATFPPALVERCIKSGSSERGCCPACGAPWVRVVERSKFDQPSILTKSGSLDGMRRNDGDRNLGGQQFAKFKRENPDKFIGWEPSCQCQIADPSRPHSGTRPLPWIKPGLTPVPSRILDPFAGSGTVGLVADRLGRDATLIDLNTSYINMAVDRIRDDCPMFTEVAAE